MNRDYYTPVQIDAFKRAAKLRRKADPSLTQAEALDQVARENNWSNWSLLMKHRLDPIQDPVTISVRDFPGGDYGVFIVEMEFLEPPGTTLRPPEWFVLPDADNWLFRSAEPEGHFAGPHLDYRGSRPRGVFVGRRWRAILSTNGVEPRDAHRHVQETMPAVLAELKARVLEMAVQQQAANEPTPGGRFRLFFAMPAQSGFPSLEERGYATLDEAKNAQLPDGCVKIGIPTQGGWWRHQIPFGWSGPH